MSSVNVTLNIFDDDGIQVDTTNLDLTKDQISDIIDHAAQVAIVTRDPGVRSYREIDELNEALVSAGVIDPMD